MINVRKLAASQIWLAVVLTFACSEEILEPSPLIEITIEEDANQNSKSTNGRVSGFSNHHYVNNLEYVLGDVKQAQIKNKFTNTSQIDNVLDGYQEMGVNGIRITIFADGVNPNVTMFDYFYNEAVSRGFKIFANPALHSGGKRIANGILYDNPNNDPSTTGPLVLGKTWAKNALVERIKEFAQLYPCDWISPFNEDGEPGSLWYANQMTNIYSELYGNLNGAELVGPCTWGVPAGTDILQQTNITNYISVATSHNLGFNHSAWTGFISSSGSFPVWDSETNNNQKYPDKATRIDAAIDAGVDGLVLYDSWRSINLNDGSLKTSGIELKEKFTQYYFIQNRDSNKRIKAYDNDTEGSLMVQVPNYWNGEFSQWEMVPVESGYFQFRNRETGAYFRPVDNNDFSDVITKFSFSGNGWHTQWSTSDAGNGNVFITNRGSGKKLKSRNSEDISTINDPELIKINQGPASWTGNQSQWQLIEAN